MMYRGSFIRRKGTEVLTKIDYDNDGKLDLFVSMRP